MDASRYFEEMHRAMSAQKNNSSLLLTVKVQDLGGADAYLELRQYPNGRARVFYSTMGRRAIPHPGRKPVGQCGLFRLHPG